MSECTVVYIDAAHLYPQMIRLNCPKNVWVISTCVTAASASRHRFTVTSKMTARIDRMKHDVVRYGQCNVSVNSKLKHMQSEYQSSLYWRSLIFRSCCVLVQQSTIMQIIQNLKLAYGIYNALQWWSRAIKKSSRAVAWSVLVLTKCATCGNIARTVQMKMRSTAVCIESSAFYIIPLPHSRLIHLT